jgi:hypothetical protein
MRVYLSELVKIAPFSVETLSGGRPLLFHPALIASSIKMFRGLGSSDLGMLFYAKNGKKLSTMMLSLNDLLKGPT